MARILFGIIPAWGHVNPVIGIARKLVEAGHDVMFAAHPYVYGAIKSAGFPCLETFGWSDMIVRVIKYNASRRSIGKFLSILVKLKGSPFSIWLYEAEKAALELESFIDRWKPDLLYLDMLFFPGILAAERKGIPYATSCPAVLPLDSAHLPQYGPGFPKDKKKYTFRERLFIGLIQKMLSRRTRNYNRLRRKFSLLPVKGRLTEPTPYLYLAYTTEAFEYPRPDLPPQVYYVGPSITTVRGDFSGEFPWAWLEGKEPVVYISLGTVQPNKKFFTRAIDACRNKPWKAVISIGRHMKKELWKDIPENVCLFNYVPQPELLKKVDAVITHGGNNTVTETLAAGVPMGVVSIASDQHEAAQRVVEAGAGIRLTLKRATTARLAEVIRELLESKKYREGAKKIAADYAKCDGPGTAAALLIKLIETRKPLYRPEGIGPTIYKGEVEKL